MFGKNIRKFREDHNFTQQDLADSLGVSRQAVCMWETGRRDMKATTLNRVARFLDVSVDEILNGKKER
ncbi:MAG: helix-turn-helix transcriptional regulator [Candidatus Omnitrophota bacterium]